MRLFSSAASRDSSIRLSLPGHLMRPDLDSTSMIGLADEEYVLSTTGRQSFYDASIRFVRLSCIQFCSCNI